MEDNETVNDELKTDSSRRCILTGGKDSRDYLIRLALAPDGSVHPDVRARAPGRGAWISVDHTALSRAITKGKLKAALQRAFKTSDITISSDLPVRIANELQQQVLNQLGIEARAGRLLSGSERIIDSCRNGRVALLLHASDAGSDGSGKLDFAFRVGKNRNAERQEVTSEKGLTLPVDRMVLSLALGRGNVVHIALTAPVTADRIKKSLMRWCRFIGWNGDTDICIDDNADTMAIAGNNVKGSD
ncbi:hypothetical protein FBY58_0590 [Zymomonas mobilis]|uniref:YlxR domain-containing protein n=1 Tax=Zymomonas mobilis TaxID=542 RepID=A0A542W0C1_ZYMMB|nr:DUF448 domain-containing protein [Zymomonas mobilis]TQL17031.1 hypothetical protein FBY58_0590 [Zymomonas mobilis]